MLSESCRAVRDSSEEVPNTFREFRTERATASVGYGGCARYSMRVVAP